MPLKSNQGHTMASIWSSQSLVMHQSGLYVIEYHSWIWERQALSSSYPLCLYILEDFFFIFDVWFNHVSHYFSGTSKPWVPDMQVQDASWHFALYMFHFKHVVNSTQLNFIYKAVLKDTHSSNKVLYINWWKIKTRIKKTSINISYCYIDPKNIQLKANHKKLKQSLVSY